MVEGLEALAVVANESVSESDAEYQNCGLAYGSSSDGSVSICCDCCKSYIYRCIR